MLGILAFASTIHSPAAWAAGAELIHLQTFKTHSRLSIRLDEGVEARWKETTEGFELLLKGIGLADLGAPVGGEKEWLAHLASPRDSRLGGLRFVETPEGVKVLGQWSFPKGEMDPANPKMEKFDFREKSPAQYVVDFWPVRSLTMGESKALNRRTTRENEIRKQQELAHARESRKQKVAQARAEAEDVGRFCREPLSEHSDVILPFVPVHEKVDFARWFQVTTPDNGYSYLEPKGGEQDAEYVRLALKLYREGNLALVVKTLDFLEAEYPRSTYRYEMRFLRANALIKLGMSEQAIPILTELRVTSGDGPVGLQAGLFTAIRGIDRGEFLASLEGFLWLIQRYPEHRMAWVFHLGAAEASYALKQTERSAIEYQWVMDNAPDRRSQSEAAFRMGDLYMTRGQYEQGLAAYFQALSRFKGESASFPALHVNRGEALYWLGQYEASKATFDGFLEKFPSHPAGWRATFRLGEIAARKNDPESRQAARVHYNETINRYPFSPGATLGRIRLLPCEDHGGFDAGSADKFFSGEALRFDGGGEIGMERYREFRGLSRIRSLITLGAIDRGIDVAIQELQANPKSQARILFGSTLRALFRKSILAKLDTGKGFEALSFYQAKIDQIPRTNGPVSIEEADYLLKLSRAASDLGLGTVASRISETYQKSVHDEGARALAGNPILEDRLQAAEVKFTQAKALWTESGAKEEVKITELLGSVNEESAHSHEREIILGLLAETAGKNATALSHALKAQLLAPRPTSPRLRAWIANLQAKAGDPRAAVTLLAELESEPKQTASEQDFASVLGMGSVPDREKLILTQGELLSKLGKWGEAAKAYSRAVEAGLGGNQALYEYSHSLARTGAHGDHEKSRKVLEKLAQSEKDDFWRKLARQSSPVGKANGNANVSSNNAKEGGK